MATSTDLPVIDLLQSMVRIDSVNAALSGRARAEDPLRDFLEGVARAWGFATRRLEVPGLADQLLVTHEAGTDRPWLLFDSHMDTVAVEGMTVDPFGGVIDGDRLYGRGACDTKGTGAAMLAALRQYAALPVGAQPNNVAILFSVDEEVGMTGIRRFAGHDLPRLPFCPIAAIVGEPTDCHPVIAHNGAMRWRIVTRGKAAHSSVPHEGKSAISAMVRVIDAIESRYAPGLTAEHPRTGRAVCTVNMIRGGSAPNIIPDHCVIEVDRRLVPGETVGDAEAGLRATLNGLDYELELSVAHPPLGDDTNAGLAAAAQGVLREMGLPGMLVGAPFATHAADLAAAGIPAIVLGPGEPWPAHTKNEHVQLAKIEQGVELYRRIMQATVTGQTPVSAAATGEKR